MLRLPPDLAREMRHLLEEAYPREGCGLLLGRWTSAPEKSADAPPTGGPFGLDIAALHPAPNAHAENPFHRYVVRREDYEAAEALAAASGLDIVGVYHGHPDSPAVPSSIDAEFAFPDWVYVIVELDGGRAVETAAWLRGEPDEPTAWTRLEIAESDPAPSGSSELSSDARSR